MIYCKGDVETVQVNGEKTSFEKDNNFVIVEVGEGGGTVFINI